MGNSPIPILFPGTNCRVVDNNMTDRGSFLSMTVSQLKEFLRKNGQLVSGKKDDLVQRAYGVKLIQSNQPAISKFDSDERVISPLCTPLGEVIPEPLSLSGWSDDVGLCPDILEKDVINYFVYRIQSKRQLKSKVFYEDRHVHSIQYHPISDSCSHCIVKCKVIPSVPSASSTQRPDYCTWIMMSKDTGFIHTADCDCAAGYGEGCNHVSALLYALVDITEKKKDGKLSCTSMQCTWNNPRKRKLSPRKSENLKFMKKDTQNKENNVQHEFKPIFNVENFKKKLTLANSNAGWLTNFAVQKPKYEFPALHDINYMYHDSVDCSLTSCSLALVITSVALAFLTKTVRK